MNQVALDHDPVDPTPGEFQTAELFFLESQVATGANTYKGIVILNGKKHLRR